MWNLDDLDEFCVHNSVIFFSSPASLFLSSLIFDIVLYPRITVFWPCILFAL